MPSEVKEFHSSFLRVTMEQARMALARNGFADGYRYVLDLIERLKRGIVDAVHLAELREQPCK